MNINLTMAVQQSLDSYWATRLDEIENEIERADNIVEYLNNLQYVNSPAYILKRYILLSDEFEVEDTIWDVGNELKVAELCKMLEILSKQAKTEIEAKVWKDIFTGKVKIQRKTAYKIAYLLKMDETTFLRLLYSIDEQTINYRNPEEFIHYFCICKNRIYTWELANKLVEKYFELQREIDHRTEKKYEVGYTTVLSGKLTDFINANIPETDVEDELLKYMLQNAEWFHGYSMKRAGMLLHMCKYLYKKYPDYSHLRPKSDNPNAVEYIQNAIKIDGNGVPKLSHLCNAMFEGGFTLRKGEKGDVFQTQIQHFCNRYYNHINAIYNNIIGQNKECNFQAVTRRDVILLSFLFFISFTTDGDNVQAEELPKYKGENERIRRIFENEEIKSLDNVLKDIQEDVDFVSWAENTESFWAEDKRVMFTDFMNEILECFDFDPIYVPNPFDRFILLCLMDAEPYMLWENALNEEF